MATRTFIGTVDGDVNNAGNYLEGYVPVNGDDLYFEQSTNVAGDTIAMDTNLEALDGVVLDELHIAATAGKIGNADLNGDYLKIGAKVVHVGYETGFSSPSLANRIKLHLLDTGVSCAVTIHDTSSTSADTGQEPCRLKVDAQTGDNATVHVRKGRVAIADQEPGETATLKELVVSYVENREGDAKVALGVGCTVATITKSGGVVTHKGTVTTVDNQAGNMTINGTGGITTITTQAGEVVCNTSGTVATINANGGTVDLSRSNVARAVTNLNRRGAGTVKYDPSIVTVTNLDTGGAVSMAAA